MAKLPDDDSDDLNAARGIRNGLLISFVFWAAIVGIVAYVFDETEDHRPILIKDDTGGIYGTDGQRPTQH